MKYRLAWMVLAAAAGCGGSAVTENANGVESIAEPILRGREETRRPYVVMIHSELSTGSVANCTGTYVAPRVVLTAAHCLRYGRWYHGTFVYWGDDYQTDVGLLEKQPIGPSKLPEGAQQWAVVEADETITGYDAEKNYPDLAVLYLDRKLPIEPLPVYPRRLNDNWVGKRATLVGWGGDEALSADIKQVEGLGVKRSGVTTLMGSPTLHDYHADDPNPGLLDRTIRSHLIKTYGRAPKPNTCAGDSGGPLIISEHGRDYIAGVSMWTGLWCEDYSLFTRLDRFLPFVEQAAERAGRASVVPRLECVEHNPDGTYSAFFGYRNENAVPVSIPYDTWHNVFPQDVQGLRPSVFEPGNWSWQFRIDFTAHQQLFWRLDPPAKETTVLWANRYSPRCPADGLGPSCLRSCQKQVAAVCDPPVSSNGTLEDCYANCMVFQEGLQEPPCLAEYVAANRCIAAQSATDPANWTCYEGTMAWPTHCEAEQQTLFTCMGF